MTILSRIGFVLVCSITQKERGVVCNCGLWLPFIITVQEDSINDMIRRTEYNIRGPLLNYYFGRKRTGRAWMANYSMELKSHKWSPGRGLVMT